MTETFRARPKARAMGWTVKKKVPMGGSQPRRLASGKSCAIKSWADRSSAVGARRRKRATGVQMLRAFDQDFKR